MSAKLNTTLRYLCRSSIGILIVILLFGVLAAVVTVSPCAAEDPADPGSKKALQPSAGKQEAPQGPTSEKGKDAGVKKKSVPGAQRAKLPEVAPDLPLPRRTLKDSIENRRLKNSSNGIKQSMRGINRRILDMRRDINTMRRSQRLRHRTLPFPSGARFRNRF